MASWKNSAINLRFGILLFLWLTFAAADAEPPSGLIGTRATERQLASISLLLYTGTSIEEYTSVFIGDVLDLLPEIDAGKPTVLYIFGWTESPSSPSVEAIVGAYLKRQDHNVILVNWEVIANEAYLVAVTSASSVGSTIADALDKLVAAGLDPSTLHIVSHSLGSQIAGFVGRSVSFTLPRITGLDPAGPGFHFVVDDLTSDDASFVDVIHTDGGFYGTAATRATVSFQPNGGTRFQSGCPILRVPLSETDFCDHHRSWYYYAESLLNEEAFIGLECRSWLAFQTGLCRSNEEVVMGYKTPTTASGNIFLQTNSQAPFGRGEAGEIYKEE